MSDPQWHLAAPPASAPAMPKPTPPPHKRSTSSPPSSSPRRPSAPSDDVSALSSRLHRLGLLSAYRLVLERLSGLSPSPSSSSGANLSADEVLHITSSRERLLRFAADVMQEQADERRAALRAPEERDADEDEDGDGAAEDGTLTTTADAGLDTSADAAATKLQALQRRRLASEAVGRKRSEAERHRSDAESRRLEQEFEDLEQRRRGATKLQAVQRGRAERAQREAEREAAVRLQAVQRGALGRQKAAGKKKEAVAATVLQSRQRGALDRKEVRQKQRAKSMVAVGSFEIGDVVKCRLAGEALWCEGIIIGRSGTEGIDEFDVDFGEGDVQEHVPASSMRKIMQWSVMEVGDQVRAPIPDMPSMKAEATIESLDRFDEAGQPFYTIRFEDDETQSDVPGSALTKIASGRAKAVVMWKKGTNTLSAVTAFSDMKWGAYRRLSQAPGPGGALALAASMKGRK